MFRKFASENIVLFDGAMGTSIQNFEIGEDIWQGKGGCSEWLNIAAPHIIESIHRSYLEAGADVVETNTFGGTELVMREYGLEDMVDELNLKGAQIAVKAAREYGRFAAGSIGPGTRLPSLGQISFDDMQLMYLRQTKSLIQGGVDLLIIETCQDLLQVKAALLGAFDALSEAGADLPVMVSVTVESTGSMLMGTDLSAVCTVLSGYPVHSAGLNCATGPDMMFGPVKTITENWNGDISCIPNAGLPENIGGKTVYSMTPEKLAAIVGELMDKYPVNIVGGCCGTTPAHIKALRTVINNKKRRELVRKPYIGVCASLYTTMPLSQNPAPSLIGERANSNGSKAFRELLLAGDTDGMLAVARNQEGEGAHFIDACVAYAGRNEAQDMGRFIFELNKTLTVPLVIDSTEPPVIEKALKLCGGKPIINSVNFEDGGEKLHTILRMIKRFPAASIALTIDEKGMAMTAAEKFAIAERLYNIWSGEYGLPPEDIIIDPLTFSIGSGDETLKMAAVETLNAIRMIKERLKGAKTVLGLSNVSFGLSALSRPVLNSVFLHEAVKAGLDMAIVHAGKILPPAMINDEDMKLSLDLIRGREGALTSFINHFQDRTAVRDEQADASLAPSEKIARMILRGEKKGLKEVLDAIMKERRAIDIINSLMLPAMQEVGELFGSGKMLLPFVLQSAEVMKEGVKILEPFMEKNETESKGKIVLATVKGDVHDIGKNLVDIILSNNGFTVYNLGIKVPVEEMIRKAVEVGADAIGMSGLLVKSTVIMKENIEELKKHGLEQKVLLGGAALTEGFVIGECDTIMPGHVFYCRDAFDALKVLDGRTEAKKAVKPVKTKTGADSVEEQAEPITFGEIPSVPFYGSKIIFDIDPGEPEKYLNKTTLFTNRWSYKKKGMTEEEFDRLIMETALPEYREIYKNALAKGLLNPAVSYGYFPCHADGDCLVIYEADRKTEKTRFLFPRQSKGAKLCLADYFLPKEEGFDVVGLSLVTIGKKPEEFSAKLYAAGDYKKYFMYHGLFTEFTEALAEYWHKVMRKEMGIDGTDARTPDGIISMKYQGRRYSFGYPACPDLDGNAVMADMLNADMLGIHVTENGEMVPEFTTSAIVVHNRHAKYFVIK
ncbi:methionine synthase [Geovibrio thiophilus]|uniref:Methionine synthase n=1 Tax=Geovibrio thiophilus TaxID=139438 RepID=A0A3R5XXN4_9BACT|nr:methionine synthase [Geovibrio thiophilus]QAR33741.1 methionine synthase [Geovibrio thiophilus]